MATSNEKSRNGKHLDLKVTFVGLEAGAAPPRFAVYRMDTSGRPVAKLGAYDGKTLSFDPGKAGVVAFAPDVEDFRNLPTDSLTRYRLAQNADLWRKRGVVLSPDIWNRFRFLFTCVSGTVHKCRPWFWELLDDIRLQPMFAQAQIARIKPLDAELLPHLRFPLNCQTVCDGVIEVYARKCCCRYIPIRIPDLLDRLRDILADLPVPIPDPIPDPLPGPWPSPGPFPGPHPGPIPRPTPGPDPAPFDAKTLRNTVRAIQRHTAPLDLASIPSQDLYRDYLALRTLPSEAAIAYVRERAYLFPLFCNCSLRKVGETHIGPGGHFDLCYLDLPLNLPHEHCFTTYAYRIKQMINGAWHVIYDGLAAHQYFPAGSPAEIHSYDPQARACADGPGEPPPNDGEAFVMLEHVGRYGTFHFNFPDQNGVSHVGALDSDDGTYTTSYAPDCPWARELGLRLWFSPELEPIVAYYRLKVVSVDDSGTPIGTPTVLNDPVVWDKFDSNWKRAPEVLGPVTIGAESDLFKAPYWNSPDHRYLSAQFHQRWRTTDFSDGRYLLLIEVFDAAGNRIKPIGATGPGTAKAFQFRRWTTSVDTDPVPFADAAHVFWIDNTPVGGDLVDLRMNGFVNTDECQYMTGNPTSTFGIGFRAYHVHGVEHAGNGDDNSFMWYYHIGWKRGLNGLSGSLGPAPSGGTNHTDVGETGDPAASGTETFHDMLATTINGMPATLHKCTFSVWLSVYAKHYNGGSRIDAYDYWEPASFSLEISS